MNIVNYPLLAIFISKLGWNPAPLNSIGILPLISVDPGFTLDMSEIYTLVQLQVIGLDLESHG